MRHTLGIAGALAVAGLVGLTGCDVRKTQEGHVQAPKYEVEKKQSGEVQLPKYDVTAPDVKVGSTQKEVTVPKVETEKKTIDVPSVDITTARDKEKQKQGG
ncbi:MULTISPECIES: hypothetical protein [Ramlibacter]|uniref:Uncharacterized protein n=1 Tax=Ramlibacter aquaticus TaxID=2780094 RepID=A0ABR9SDZ8_9BURK|nr:MULTISPECIES: hypothetical protein [Ramlibacter]MBE7940583.1 hypothetical protein [Ramlibacter aquaticus]